jgi:hypothetical protein
MPTTLTAASRRYPAPHAGCRRSLPEAGRFRPGGPSELLHGGTRRPAPQCGSRSLRRAGYRGPAPQAGFRFPAVAHNRPSGRLSGHR